MSETKLSTNIVIRASDELKKALSQLAAGYGTDSSEVARRLILEALRLWRVPGFTKRSKPSNLK